MKGQLNTLNLRNNKESTEPPQQEENERFYQEERIRRTREEADTQAMQDEILSAEKKETGRDVGKSTFTFMLVVAITADITLFLIAFIPYVGWIINLILTPCVFLTFFIWFKVKGIKFNSPRKLATLPVGFLIELIPYINILPGWTVSVIINTQSDKLAAKMGVK